MPTPAVPTRPDTHPDLRQTRGHPQSVQRSSHVVRSGGVRLHARLTQPRDDAARQRPAIVLVHGYPDDSSVWDGVRDALARHSRVITFDVRGAGLSDAPADTTGYSARRK